MGEAVCLWDQDYSGTQYFPLSCECKGLFKKGLINNKKNPTKFRTN